MLISLDKINKYYGGEQILSNVSVTIEDYDRIGLIGVNGAGKSTLLNIIDGSLEFDDGSRDVKNNVSMGFLRQNSGLTPTNTIYKELRDVFTHVNNAMNGMHDLELKMSNIANHDSLEYKEMLSNYSLFQGVIDANDGYNMDVRINTILNGMSFGDRSKDTLISTLSGGEKTRLALCKLLLESPKLLILDEPTNHLDFSALLWLEDYLKNYKGALLIVSHDRFFLDSLVTQIWEVEHKNLIAYPGNYTKFVQLKEEALIKQEKDYIAQQQEIKRLEEYVAKNIVRATSSKSAKNKQKSIDHMELVDKPLSPPKIAKLRFTYDREPVKDILDISKLSIIVGSGENKKHLLNGLDMHIFRNEKIAIIGENGVGKSSLLKAIQDIIPYSAGLVLWGRNTQISYFEQESTKLNMNKTALDEIWDRFPASFEHTVRTALGNVLITGEESKKLVGDLSGGERAKLKFAIMSMEKGNVLILDEPTNHLDLNSKEVLDKALSEFEGTIIMVSHDRYLLSKVPTKIIEFSRNGKIEYLGNYKDYMDKQKDNTVRVEKIPQEKPAVENKAVYAKSKEMRSLIASLRNEKTKLELIINNYEIELTSLEEAITTPEYVSDYLLLNNSCIRIEELKPLLDQCYERWLEINEQIPTNE